MSFCIIEKVVKEEILIFQTCQVPKMEANSNNASYYTLSLLETNYLGAEHRLLIFFPLLNGQVLL